MHGIHGITRETWPYAATYPFERWVDAGAPMAPTGNPSVLTPEDRRTLPQLPFEPATDPLTAEPLLVFHGTRVGVDFATFSMDGPAYDDAGEPVSSGSGGDVGAYLGAHFAREYRVAESFARRGHQWMRTRYDGEREDPRVLRCAVAMKNPCAFRTEEGLRKFIYRGVVNDEYLLERAAVRDGVLEAEGERWEKWLSDYDAKEDFRVEANTYIFERMRREEDGLSESIIEAARDLGQSARDRLRQAGFDGVVYNNAVEGGQSMVVLDPAQVAILSVDRMPTPAPEAGMARLYRPRSLPDAGWFSPNPATAAWYGRMQPEGGTELDFVDVRELDLERYRCAEPAAFGHPLPELAQEDFLLPASVARTAAPWVGELAVDELAQLRAEDSRKLARAMGEPVKNFSRERRFSFNGPPPPASVSV